MEEFYRMMKITPTTTVLDVGGTLLNWKFAEFIPRLTILNINPPNEGLMPGVEWVIGDARCMGFKSTSFDVVFSNSVIEHVGGWEDQLNFAEEIRRVGKRYFVQTPNYWFPIEPHLLAPFVHWLPRRVGEMLLLICLRSLITMSVSNSKKIFDEVRLLKPNEMRILFPDAKIVFEKFLGLPKSIYAIKE